MERRSFLQGIFAAAMAPAIVKAESLMQVKRIILLDEQPEAFAGLMKPGVYVKEVDISHIIKPKLWSFGDPYDAAIADLIYTGNSIEETLKRSRAKGSTLSELRMMGVLK